MELFTSALKRRSSRNKAWATSSNESEDKDVSDEKEGDFAASSMPRLGSRDTLKKKTSGGVILPTNTLGLPARTTRARSDSSFSSYNPSWTSSPPKATNGLQSNIASRTQSRPTSLLKNDSGFSVDSVGPVSKVNTAAPSLNLPTPTPARKGLESRSNSLGKTHRKHEPQTFRRRPRAPSVPDRFLSPPTDFMRSAPPLPIPGNRYSPERIRPSLASVIFSTPSDKLLDEPEDQSRHSAEGIRPSVTSVVISESVDKPVEPSDKPVESLDKPSDKPKVQDFPMTPPLSATTGSLEHQLSEQPAGRTSSDLLSISSPSSSSKGIHQAILTPEISPELHPTSVEPKSGPV
ncbi:hypothetical protein BGZ80_006189, partial [Entomortierella chlamydospora]